MMQEIERKTISGYLMLAVCLLLHILFIAIFVIGIRWGAEPGFSIGALSMVIGGVLGFALVVFLDFGFFMVHPNQARVLQLFGAYAGTAHEPGLRYANPFYTKRRISMRVRNFESGMLKVNDAGGSPIEIASVVVWKVVDTAEAVFEVDDYKEFVKIQSEAALRLMASTYPYESRDEKALTLRGSPAEVAETLKKQVQNRLGKAGVEVLEARISHLAYAPEIASAMLRRQQAGAIIAAKEQIVEGAVGMVHSALEKLEKDEILELDEERKASMVSNLLVVLCSDSGTQPVVNTGSLYG